MAVFKPEDYDHLIGTRYRRDHDGYEYKLIGMMWGEDDWYWVLTRGNRVDKHTVFLSCVGNIEAFGFEKV